MENNDWIKNVEKSAIDQEFKTGLSHDMSGNIRIISARIWLLQKGKNAQELKPLKTFAEYMATLEQRGYDEKYMERYREKSQPEAIAAYDALVGEFNSKIDIIKDDIKALQEYEDKFREMFYGKNSQ